MHKVLSWKIAGHFQTFRYFSKFTLRYVPVQLLLYRYGIYHFKPYHAHIPTNTSLLHEERHTHTSTHPGTHSYTNDRKIIHTNKVNYRTVRFTSHMNMYFPRYKMTFMRSGT